MTSPAYETDLAYVHDVGFGGFARGAAPGLLSLLRRAGVAGRVMDLGCGGGIWARELADAGYQVVGVDISPAMIDLARRRVPEATFQVGSFLQFDIPFCGAVTALGEVFNYLFDAGNSLRSLRQVCRKAFDALTPRGLLIFDVAEPGRCQGVKQAFREGKDWACLVEFDHDAAKRVLSRRIVTFRKIGAAYRRHEETHRQRLYEAASVARMLRGVGFRVQVVRRYGTHALPQRVAGFIARKA
jgi:SAM-dependent methyltransferase